MNLSELVSSLPLEPWVWQAFVVVFLTLVASYAARGILLAWGRRLELTATPWDDALVDSLRRPLRVLIWVVGIAFAASLVPVAGEGTIFEAIDAVRDVGVVACIAWFLVRFVARVEANLVARADRGERALDRATLDAVAKLLRASIIITAALVVMQTLGFSISGVLAFGGIGGIAVGFAARDMLANFFGGLMIYLDRPFAIGDWIRSPDRSIEGTVELEAGHAPGTGARAVLYIIARPAGAQGGPPLAVKRIVAPAFPVSFSLGPNDVMIQGTAFEGPLNLTARLDRDGDPLTREAGEPAGAHDGNPVSPGARNVVVKLR